MPAAVILEVEIKEECIPEFTERMMANAVGSRTEPGCLYFDFLRVKDSNTFVTYEIFVDEAAQAVHKEKEYVKAWGAYQYGEAKPVINKKVSITETLDFMGTVPSAEIASPPHAIMLEVEIKEECVPQFIDVMTADAVGSRQEAGCLYFDFLRVKDSNTFITYEVFADESALDAHKGMPYVKEWGAFQYGELKPVINKRVLPFDPLLFAACQCPKL